ncbi:response regulator transcription factor [bacterium]|nr:response regulator transcription factor [bacterium]
MSIKIVIADDHEIMREGLRNLLEEQYNMEVVGEAENGRRAVELVEELNPDVVVMDISMPDLNGIEATRQVIKVCPGVKVVALSMHSQKRFVKEMLQAGASGYVLKNDAFTELIKAINSVNIGDKYLSTRITGEVIDEFVGSVSEKKSTLEPGLTAREREVLQLLAEGKTTKEIAQLLFVSERTVDTHRTNIMKKLDIHTIAGLTKYAINEGLTSTKFF